MKYKTGQKLISKDGDIISILECIIDHHTRKKDYLIETIINNSFIAKQQKYWVHATIIESSYYRPLNETERVLYGDRSDN